jgi:hypothetical protein
MRSMMCGARSSVTSTSVVIDTLNGTAPARCGQAPPPVRVPRQHGRQRAPRDPGGSMPVRLVILLALLGAALAACASANRVARARLRQRSRPPRPRGRPQPPRRQRPPRPPRAGGGSARSGRSVSPARYAPHQALPRPGDRTRLIVVDPGHADEVGAAANGVVKLQP